MERKRIGAGVGLAVLLCVAGALAQQGQPAADGSSASATVPRLIKYSGAVRDARGELLGNVAVSLTFSVYEEQAGGAAIWAEAQMAQLDEQGHYSVLLGATRGDGLPVELFPAGKARWLGVQVEGRDEDPRVLLVSVPYALKAEDAAMLGGRRASDFVLAEQLKEEVKAQVEAQKPAVTSSIEMLLPGQPIRPELTAATSTFTCSTAGDCVTVQQSGAGRALRPTATSASEAVLVQQYGTGYGLRVLAPSNTALFGQVTTDSGTTYGVRGATPSTSGAGVYGSNTATTGLAYGVRGNTTSPNGAGVAAFNTSATGTAYALLAQTSSTGGTALYGRALAGTGGTIGLWGDVDSTSGTGVVGRATTASGVTTGVYAEAKSAEGTALIADNLSGGKIISGWVNGLEKFGVDGSGNVSATGSVTGASFAGSGSALTALNASNLASGTVPSARISGTYSSALTFNNASNVFAGDGSGLTNLPGVGTATDLNCTGCVSSSEVSFNYAGSSSQGGAATSAGTADTATNALSLGGVVAGNYARTDTTNTFNGNQTIQSGGLSLPSTSGGGVGVLNLGGQTFVHGYGATSNAFVGANAGGAFTATGGYNTGTGYVALYSLTSGTYNTASGYASLNLNTTGYNNSALGNQSLAQNTSGYNNVAVGGRALQMLSTGGYNTAVGYYALNGATGNWNTAIGYHAGYVNTSGGDNIYINHYGVASENNTARIGGSYISRTFIAGIRGVTTGNANAILVYIDSAGQLGTMSSSRRVKRDIRNMGDTTGALMGLRPVRFHYKAHGANAPEQYGLVAEEVAEVAPDLVAHNSDGEIETVFYDKVNAMLLNEVQKQHRLIQNLEEQVESQEELIRKLEFRLTQLERQTK